MDQPARIEVPDGAPQSEKQAWQLIAARLEPAMEKLRASQRESILRHCFENEPVPDGAAGKMLDRALSKLVSYFTRHKLKLSTDALSDFLKAHAAPDLPADLVQLILTTPSPAAQRAAQLLARAQQRHQTMTRAALVAIIFLALAAAAIYILTSDVFKPHTRASQVTSARAINWAGNPQSRFGTALARDASNKIWVASEDQGVWCLDPAAANASPTHYTTAQGLAEDAATAIAVDHQGRVWVGHVSSGVSVFDAKAWKTYNLDAGPLGSRIFRIAVVPRGYPNAGDVWLATDRGLTRYSPAKDAWSYYTRLDGLPSDQASALAFDRDGRIYVATQCDGLAIASASDDYRKWRTAHAPAKVDPSARGAGLPGDVLNDVIVAHDGTLYVGSTQGLGISRDHGDSFTYLRGSDWYERLRNSTSGLSAPRSEQTSGPLAETSVTCIAEDDAGLLWVGHRLSGLEVLDPVNWKRRVGPLTTAGDQPTAILALPGEAPYIAGRGTGVQRAGTYFDGKALPAEAPAAPSLPAKFPAPAVPTIAQLRALVQKIPSTQSSAIAAYLGDDWATRGDWVGRYGRQQTFWPHYHAFWSANTSYELSVSAGPHRLPEDRSGDGVYTYYASLNAQSPSALYSPGRGRRMEGEWNDGSWQRNYMPTWEGPDLWMHFVVPEGVHRASFYIHNNDPLGNLNLDRQYLLELKSDADDPAAADALPTLARTRFCAGISPVYKSFLVRQGAYWLKVGRQGSHCTKVQGAFFDRVDAPADDGTSHYLQGLNYAPPPIPAPRAGESELLQAARELWQALDAASDPSAAAAQRAGRVLAYRAAAAAGGADLALLANWRWKLPLWTDADRAEWNRVMAESRKKLPAESSG
jgi:hypothetical protein